jgi:aminopeptidase N
MFVWWMLRDMLGEAPLKKALTAYHADQDKEPSYMQHLLEAQSKRDLEWFFDGWVYRDRGLPDFKIDSAIPRETVGGGSIYTVTVINTGDVGAEVPVTLHMDGADSTERLQVNAKSKASIRMRAVAPVHEIVVNDGSVPESDLSNNVFKVDAVDQ